MLKIIAVIFLCAGIFIGVNFSDEIESLFESSAFEQAQDTLEDGKDLVMDKIEEIKD